MCISLVFRYLNINEAMVPGASMNQKKHQTMKTKRYKVYLFFTAVVLFASCTVYKQYPIEIYQPGQIALKPNTGKIALVYRNFHYSNDTLLHYYKTNYSLRKAKTDPKNLDSILVRACLNGFSNQIKLNTSVKDIEILPLETFKPHSATKMPQLNLSALQQITSPQSVETLIVLDTYSSFYSEYPSHETKNKSNEVFTVAVWSVYDIPNQKLMERKSMVDTISWDGYNADAQGNRQLKLPDRLSALKIASNVAGETYAKRFHASWITVGRNYSIPPLPDFSAAADFLEKGKYDTAISIWEKYISEKNSKLAIIACYNIALAYELKDDLDRSKEYLVLAMKFASRRGTAEDKRNISEYLKIIEKRQKDLLKLGQL